MNKCALLFMLLSILPASAKMIAQDNEVYELKTKLEYAEDFAKLHPDPGLLFMVKNGLNSKWVNMANMAHQSGLQRFITKDLLGNEIRLTSARSYDGSLKKEQEENLLELYRKQRDDLQKEFDNLENFPRKKELYNLAQSNLEEAKAAYDKALMNYFELKKEVS